MEHIIQQIAGKLTEKITERLLLERRFDIDDFSKTALEDCKMAAIQIAETVYSEMNLAVREDKETRLEQGLLMKEKERKRQILTELGEFNIERDYYYDRKKKSYVFPLDQLLGIEPRDRISSGLSAELVALSTEHSYAQSSKLMTKGRVSRQTVRNKILKAPDLEKLPNCEEKKKVRELHIFADEDHVHLQKPGKAKGKKSRMVPLVTVTEGVKRKTGRHNTINPVHFVDSAFSSKAIWEDVEGFVNLQYDMESVEKIYIHGDGAAWIKSGTNSFSNAEHIIDGYHLGKYLRALNNSFPKQRARQTLENAIKGNNKEKADEFFVKLAAEASDPKKTKLLEYAKSYFNSNWDGIVGRRTLDIPGSCTEGQVSHVLSCRFSRNPMGWSNAGLGKLSKLRVYKKNGGKIKAEHFKETYVNSEQILPLYRSALENVAGSFDWSIFEGGSKTIYAHSGTQELLKLMGRQRSII